MLNILLIDTIRIVSFEYDACDCLSRYVKRNDKRSDLAFEMEQIKKTQKRISKGPQRSEESHAAILMAAETLLNEKGAAAVTFEAIAKRARASRSTLYRWWPDKLSLLLELHDQQKERSMRNFDTGNLRSDLKAYTKELWSFWRQNNMGAAFAALISEAQITKNGQKRLDQHFNNNTSGPSISYFKRALLRGELTPGADIALLRKTYIATNWFHLLTGSIEDKSIDRTIDLLMDGFLKSSSS